MSRVVLAVLAGLAAPCVAGACVGDDPSAGTDAAAPDVAAEGGGAVDDAPIDREVDAASPTCRIDKPFGQPTALSALNTSGNDGVLRLTADSKTGYFHSIRDGGAGFEDIWVSSRPNAQGAFGAPTSVPNVNGTKHEWEPAPSADGLTLVFVSDRGGGLDLWMAVRGSVSVPFGSPTILTNVNSSAVEQSPFLRSDGKVLYFASTRTPTQGLQDLWKATWNGADFMTPEPVEGLASSALDAWPAVTTDDLVIYFASRRAGGKGDMDMWVASRQSANEPFSNVTNVAELNGPKADTPSFISDDRCTLYFTVSTPPTTAAIYVATRTPD